MAPRSLLSRVTVVYAIVALCVTSSLGANALSLGGLGGLLAPTPVNVGYSGDPAGILGIVGLVGGILEARDDGLHVLTVDVPNPLGLISLLAGRLDVRYVQVDEAVGSASTGSTATRWDATRWDATRWDATRWDATRWDSTNAGATRWDGTDWQATRWDGTEWDATRWDATRWDATRWDGHAADGSTSAFAAMDPGLPYQWGLGAIDAPGAWAQTVGTHNTDICVIDSGVQWTHPDLSANVWTAPDGSHGFNFLNKSTWPMDDGGHGTHVAGIAAAVSGNGVGVSGVAQERIMAVKVLDANGAGRESHAAFALRWCADHGAKIASLSLGTSKDKMVLRDGVLYAQARGLLVVAAAGNEGCACARYPAAYPGVLSVASFDRNGTHSSFSNTGSWVQLSAPGEHITSTYLNGYAIGSGTSQATPFVAGAAALAWGANPALSATQVASILKSTATDLGARGKDAQFGYGAVDARAAVAAAIAAS